MAKKWWHDISDVESVTKDKAVWVMEAAEKNLNFHAACRDSITANTERVLTWFTGGATALAGYWASGAGEPSVTHWGALLASAYLFGISFGLAQKNLLVSDAWPVQSEPKQMLTKENFDHSFPLMLLGFTASMQERIEKYRKSNDERGAAYNSAVLKALFTPVAFVLPSIPYCWNLIWAAANQGRSS